MYCQVPSQGCFSSVNINKDLHHCCPQRENKHLTLQQSVLSFLFASSSQDGKDPLWHIIELKKTHGSAFFCPFFFTRAVKPVEPKISLFLATPPTEFHPQISSDCGKESTMVQVFLDIKSHCEVAYHYPWAPLAPDLSFFTGGGRIFSPIRMSAPSLLNTCPASSTFNSLLYPTIFNQLQYLSPSS